VIRIRNNPLIQALVGTGVLLSSTAALATDDVSVVARPPVHYVTVEEAAITSCLTAFVRELFPAQRPIVRTVILGPGETDQGLRSTGGDSAVEMQATTRSTGEIIARSQCVASRNARVKWMHTDVRNASLLAASAPQDLNVKIASR